MTTSITRPWKDRRTHQQKQEDALLAAFRRLDPTERCKLIRLAQMRRSTRVTTKEIENGIQRK